MTTTDTGQKNILFNTASKILDGFWIQMFVVIVIWNINRNENTISQKENFTVPGYHTLILASRDRIPTVILSLYERPFALIRLTEDTNFMGEEEIYAGLIDYRSGSHQVLNYQNDPVSFYERFYVNNIQ